MTRDTSITPPSILVNHPNHEWTVFSIFMLRTDRTSGHSGGEGFLWKSGLGPRHFDDLGFFTSATCPRSEVRATAEVQSLAKEFRTGRSQGNLARTPDVAVVTPLNNFMGPEGDTVTVAQQLLNTEY